MSNAGSAISAGYQVRDLLERSIHGSKISRKREVDRGFRIGVEIWKTHQVSVRSWQVKHLHSFLRKLADKGVSPPVQYQHWLTVKRILAALDKLDAWGSLLRGPWETPTGGRLTGAPQGRPVMLPLGPPPAKRPARRPQDGR